MKPIPVQMLPDELQAKINSVKYWYHRIEVAPGIFTPGTTDPSHELKLLDLPQDCSGLRVLDIGARDGFFSFEMEKRGASVLALDFMSATSTGFAVARELLSSRAEHIHMNVYDISESRLGKFDIVLFLGVLYHLRHPLLALERIREVCKLRLWAESHVINGELARRKKDLLDLPLMRFFPGGELNGDHTNWWGPNTACLREMLRSANFKVLSERVYGDRAIMMCETSEDPTVTYYQRIDRSIIEG